MLLRRVMQHVRTQNWLAVGIDFVIVVVGVYIGIQLGNWNEERSRAEEERAVVLQLVSEARETDTRIASNRLRDEARFEAALRALTSLRADDLGNDSNQALREDLDQLGPWASGGFVTATLDEIVTSGKLSVIRDDGLRILLARYREEVTINEIAFENVGRMNLDHAMALGDRIDVVFGADGREIITPADQLLQDLELERTVGSFAFTYDVFRNLHQSAAEINAAYLEALVAHAEAERWLD